MTIAITKQSASPAVTESPKPATPIDQPEEATFTFIQQDAPLLQLPGELRNRIYHEVFRAIFDKLEAKMRKNVQLDPKVLRSALAGLTACRQLYQEGMAPFLREHFAQKTYWRLRDMGPTSRFFVRVASLCRALKRLAPNTRLAVEQRNSKFLTGSIAPASAKAFLEELASQVQQDVCINFTTRRSRERNSIRTTYSDAAIWDACWSVKKLCLEAKGSVGGYRFAYLCWKNPNGRIYHSSLQLEGCLVQLDW